MAGLVGQMLGPYQILSEIGHGGMANVYLATQSSVGREVALKVLPLYFLQDQAFLDRFNREIRIIAQLQHPRILPVYDSGDDHGRPYIVMAYVPGGTLADRIKAFSGGMPVKEIVRLTGQIAEGLDYAHEKGIIHRDFKPSNILIDHKENIYLADFGIARVIADAADSTGNGVIGTPHYMAPELSQGGKVTPSVDVYALGVTLFEMATGTLPYKADTPIGVILAHSTLPVPNVRELRPRLPSAVQQVIAWAMAKNPADRPGSAGELSQLLERAMSIAGPDTAVISSPEAVQATVVRTPQSQPGATMPDEPAPPPGGNSTGDVKTELLPQVEYQPAEIKTMPGKSGRIVPLLLAAGGGALLLIGVVVAAVVLIGSLAKSNGVGTPAAASAPPPSLTPVAHNRDWTPVVQVFDGVAMVQVPPGCFVMGNDSGDNERPTHQQCFDNPFWIDRTEVTNAEFTKFGGEAASPSQWSGDNRPREHISWVEAAAFCRQRGMRLPTEVEWEYAARGPDALNYPWGNTFDPGKVVFAKNSGGQTTDVGSKPDGASWVGALDMSGSVYEWVSSIFRPYPYRADDGRESDSDRTHTRVARGGAWSTSALTALSSSFRSGDDPSSAKDDYGLRCAHSD